MMKRKRKNRIIIAWVLLMTLMPISIVKATHHHDIEEVASSQSTDPGQKTAGTTTTPALFATSFYLLSSNPNHSIFSIPHNLSLSLLRNLVPGRKRHLCCRQPYGLLPHSHFPKFPGGVSRLQIAAVLSEFDTKLLHP